MNRIRETSSGPKSLCCNFSRCLSFFLLRRGRKRRKL